MPSKGHFCLSALSIGSSLLLGSCAQLAQLHPPAVTAVVAIDDSLSSQDAHLKQLQAFCRGISENLPIGSDLRLVAIRHDYYDLGQQEIKRPLDRGKLCTRAESGQLDTGDGQQGPTRILPTLHFITRELEPIPETSRNEVSTNLNSIQLLQQSKLIGIVLHQRDEAGSQPPESLEDIQQAIAELLAIPGVVLHIVALDADLYRELEQGITRHQNLKVCSANSMDDCISWGFERAATLSTEGLTSAN